MASQPNPYVLAALVGLTVGTKHHLLSATESDSIAKAATRLGRAAAKADGWTPEGEDEFPEDETSVATTAPAATTGPSAPLQTAGGVKVEPNSPVAANDLPKGPVPGDMASQRPPPPSAATDLPQGSVTGDTAPRS